MLLRSLVNIFPMNSRIPRVLALLAVFVFVSAIMPAFAAERITPTTTYGAEAAWNYSTYTVNRFSPSEGKAFRQVEGLDALREQGILAVSNDKSQLFILREGVLRMEQTPFTLPLVRDCYGCATSLTVSEFGKGYLVGNRIVVTTNDKWYLYDPFTEQAELWFDPAALAMAGGFSAVATNNQLYVYSVSSPTTSPTTYRVSKPNQLEQLLGLPSGVRHAGYRLHVDQVEVPTSSIAGFIATDDFGATGMQVGQVGIGVYVQQYGNLTRIGYSSSLYGYAWTMSFTPKTVLAYGASNAAWVGQDGDLYVATIVFDRLKPTGFHDVPARTPFRTASNPAVFYDAVNPDPVTVYMTSAAYVRAFNDPEFSKVITIPDTAFNAALGITEAKKIY